MVLPKPTYTPPDPSKKSHARKQPEGHIPRPRNAFILFRCDFVRQKKIPESVENDHRNISRIVGRIWREMTKDEKSPWVKMAEREKQNHQEANPTYRFNPGIPNLNPKKKAKKGDDVPGETQEDDVGADEAYLALQRAYSCPVGVPRVPQANLESLTGYGTPMVTRDDLARRPSRVMVYQSGPYDLKTQTTDLECHSDIANQRYFTEALAEGQPPQLSATDDDPPHEKENTLRLRPQQTLFCGPYFDPRGDAYAPIPRPGEGAVPEWDESPSGSANVMAFNDWLASNHADTDPEPYFMDVLRSSLPRSIEPRSGLPYPIGSIRTERELPSFQSPGGGWKLPLPLSPGSSSRSPAASNPAAHLGAEELEDGRLNPLYRLDHAEIFREYFAQKGRPRMPENPQRQVAVGFRNPWADNAGCFPPTTHAGM